MRKPNTNSNPLIRMPTTPQSHRYMNQSSIVELYYPPPPPTPSPVVTIPRNIENIPREKKMLWGEPIWFLFHTLAEKVKEEHFSTIKGELLSTIYSICSNLPCPKCTEHAKEYMSKVNFQSIQTKTDLKMFLLQFHNEVNNRKGYDTFSYNNLDEKYSKANTINIIHNFMNTYQKTSFNVTLLTENTQRMMLCNRLKRWFSANIQYFHL